MISRVLPALVLLCLATGADRAAAQAVLDIDLRIEEATAERLSGNAETAVTLLERLAVEAPENADVEVQLGFALLALRNLPEARAAFERALALAPDYVDANLGLALIAFRSGDLLTAERNARAVLGVRTDAEATQLLAQIADARAASAAAPGRLAVLAPAAPELGLEAPPETKSRWAGWRFDIDGTFSDLAVGYPDWKEAAFRVGYEVSPRTTVSLAVEISTRGSATDIRLETRVDRSIAPGLSAYAFVAGTPDPDFRPGFAFGVGGSWNLAEGSLPLDLLLDVSGSLYPDSRSLTLSPGLRLHIAGDRAALTIHAINGFNQPGTHTLGYSLRGDIQATDWLAVFVGYADAPEFDAGQRVEVRSLFGGLSLAVTDLLVWRASVSTEQRSVGSDRLVASTGIGLRF